MSISNLPLSYCTNVHPARTLAEVEQALDRYTVKIAERFGKPLAAGLWLPRSVVKELIYTTEGVSRLREGLGLAGRGLSCHTLNAFPFGDFHSPRVKENVYLPDWSHGDRLSYTQDCATILAHLLPKGGEGSISTLPLGFKGAKNSTDFLDDCAQALLVTATFLHRLHTSKKKMIRLAVEPEPLCVLETTAETIEFFGRLHEIAKRQGKLDIVRDHVGVCYDVCHQAVEFEDVAQSIRDLEAAGIRINKVHISAAIELKNPAGNAEGRTELLRYVEPRYLHQTFAKTAAGKIVHETDLNESLISNPSPDFAGAEAWRVHFHVPIDAENLGPLATTRPELIKALKEVGKLNYAPHLEVETYTWQVLPGAGPMDLVEGLARELKSADRLVRAD